MDTKQQDPNINYAGGHDNMGYNPPPQYMPQQPYPGVQYAQQQGASTIIVQQPQHSTVITRSAPDNMGLAIFACLCCFWPLGIAAIIKANESQNAIARGDFDQAVSSGQDARRFSLISIGIGVALIILSIILSIVIPVVAYNSAVSRRY